PGQHDNHQRQTKPFTPTREKQSAPRRERIVSGVDRTQPPVPALETRILWSTIVDATPSKFPSFSKSSLKPTFSGLQSWVILTALCPPRDVPLMAPDESVSHWLSLLQSDGDAAAAQRLWERYFHRLV